MLADPCRTKPGPRRAASGERSGLQYPKSLGGKSASAGRVSGFSARQGRATSSLDRLSAGSGGSAPRGECLGWREPGQGCGGPSEPHLQDPGPRGSSTRPCRGGAEAPRADTHRAAVLLQRHQLAPDVDRLEVVEVLLPLRAGRGRQEQPRRHQRSHHDWIPSCGAARAKSRRGHPSWGAGGGGSGAGCWGGWTRPLAFCPAGTGAPVSGPQSPHLHRGSVRLRAGSLTPEP